MTERQEKMLKTFVRINGFDFDTKLQVGDLVFTINQLKLNNDITSTTMIIHEILRKRFKFYSDRDKVINEWKDKIENQNKYWTNKLKQMRIAQYKERITFYKTNKEIFKCRENRYLTSNEIEEMIKRNERLLDKELWEEQTSII